MSMPQKVSQTRYARRRLVIAGVGALAVGLSVVPSAAQPSAVATGAAAVTADSGTWIQISSMTRARSHHFAAVLSDGRVLVTNGGTAEIYDRKTDRWREPRLPNSRHGFRSTAVTLIDADS